MKEKDILKPEEELDDFIDKLNDGSLDFVPKRNPESEFEEIQDLAFSLNQSNKATPREGFINELWEDINKLPKAEENIFIGRTEKIKKEEVSQVIKDSQRKKTGFMNKKFIWPGLVAGLLIMLLVLSPWGNSTQNIVLAMEESVKKLSNYYGVLEKVSTNAAGESQVILRTEIWSQGNSYATRTEEGFITVNNGDTRWTVDESKKEITLIPVYLDTRDFDLQKEAAKALSYPHEIMGDEMVAGRNATRVEIQPPGGLPYTLWIDQETHLPIQLKTAMQKSLQTTYTYVTLETNTTLPEKIFTYNPSSDYRIVDQNQDRLVSSLEEAKAVSGITPLELKENPAKVYASAERIVMDFGDTILIQSKTQKPLILDPLAILGKAEGGALEILPHSLRWQQNNLEIQLLGERVLTFARELSPTIDLNPQTPPPGSTIIPVPVDMEIVQNNQQQVDSGSSPWQLDPLQVAFTFIALQISPEGIQGEPPLSYDSLQLIANDGQKAVIEAKEGPVAKVHLERLIRQDETGIWTVTGYEPQ